MTVTQVKKIAEGAYFVIDTTNYLNQITPFDLTVATQTISSVDGESVSTNERLPDTLDEVDKS